MQYSLKYKVPCISQLLDKADTRAQPIKWSILLRVNFSLNIVDVETKICFWYVKNIVLTVCSGTEGII